MLQTDILHSGHADLVTDLCYDFYGERLATGSADQKIKVWRKDTRSSNSQNDGQAKQNWENEAEWKAHDAPILKLSWAHPEFGSILASSSYDRSVRIWEEVGGHSVAVGAATSQNANGNGSGNEAGAGGTSGGGKKRWVERALMNEARGSVKGVEFGHNAFGLKLASISTDSHLRIYTSLSPSLNDWHLSHSLHIPSLQSPDHHHQIDGLSTPQLGGHTGSITTGFSGLNGSSAGAGAGAGGSNPSGPGGTSGATAALGQSNTSTSFNLTAGSVSSGSGSGMGSGTASGSVGSGFSAGKGAEVLGGWGLSWCKEKWGGEVVAVTAGHLGVIKIVSLSTPQPSAVLTLTPPPTPLLPPTSTFPSLTPQPSGPSSGSGSRTPQPHQPHPQPYPAGAQAITSLSWAPSCGKAYYLIASGHRDGTVRIWRVINGEEGRWSGGVVEEWGRGEATIGRVEWNITGSILSVASEDGKIRLYKATYAGKWECMGTFTAEAPSDEGDGEGEGDEGMQE